VWRGFTFIELLMALRILREFGLPPRLRVELCTKRSDRITLFSEIASQPSNNFGLFSCLRGKKQLLKMRKNSNMMNVKGLNRILIQLIKNS